MAGRWSNNGGGGGSSSNVSTGGGSSSSSSGGGGRRRISPVIVMVVLVAVVVVVVGEQQQLQQEAYHHHHHLHHRHYPHLPTFAIMNGSLSVIREGQNGFIYCFANLRLPLRVAWTDPDGMSLPPYTSTEPPSTGMGVSGGEGEVYEVSGAYPIPFAFLIFRGFSTNLSGRYTCTLAYGNTRLATRTTHLHFFAPSYRVVPVPQCLIVPRGGAVLLPSPVQGSPPRPPAWSLLEGERDNAAVRTLNGRLLLRGLQGPVAWRAEVTLGGGLTFFQDVFVSVQDGGGGGDGGGGENGGRRGVISSTPTAARTCPTHAHASPGSPYVASAALANEVIQDIQIHAFRRRLMGEE